MSRPGRYAAIDIGTVTCRLMIADVAIAPDGGAVIDILYRSLEIVNLGEGVDATRRLSDSAMERTANAIDGFLEVISEFEKDAPISAISVVATSASRDADNSDEFKEILASRGLAVDVIEGSMEASLSFMGASAAYADKNVVVVDCGGGSTEIAFGLGCGGLVESHSFDIGCRRVTERFMPDHPPTVDQIENARTFIKDTLNSWESLKSIPGDSRVLAVAGTATTIVTIRDAITEYDPALVDGQVVEIAVLEDILEKLLGMTLSELEAVDGLDPRRAHVICAGMLILLETLRALDKQEFTASEADILNGMIMYNSKKID